ncbi:MAG TPA: outer membrane lipoprotein carrier protein LolA [Firmicutes bacterium]|nr:outer membrane lipoprotein carrier protein LolA [Bacillota bacterium]
MKEMIMKKFLILILSVFFAVLFVCGDSLDSFITLLNQNPTMRGTFSQRTYSYLGEAQDETKGVLWFRPEKEFRVEYTYPVKEVILTNDSGYVNYIPEDDELIQGGLEDFIFVSPFAMLKEARTYFDVEKKSERNFVLSSRGEETGDIEKISITFGADGFPSKLNVDFHSGNMVFYTFKSFRKISYNPSYFDLSEYSTFFSGL